MTPAWVGWVMLAAVIAAIFAAFCWPTDDDTREHPGFDDLKDDQPQPDHVCRQWHPTGAGDRAHRDRMNLSAREARIEFENKQQEQQ